MKKLFSALFGMLVAWSVIGVVAACSSKDNPQPTPPKEDSKVEVTQVTLNQTTASLVVGGTVTLTATVSPANATDKTVTWSTSNAGVATVSNGLVTAVAEGTATITATAGTKSATCSVQVKPKTVAVTGITLNKSELSVFVDDTFQLEATVSPADATDKTVTWSTSNAGVATVSNGLVTAVAEGTATITATAGTKSATCSVEVKPKTIDVTGITLNKSELSIFVGDTFLLEATVSPADATDKTLSWRSDNPSLATVDQNGLVTALSPGTCTVSAVHGSIVASCVIHCSEKPKVTSIVFEKGRYQVHVGKTVKLVYSYYPADATNTDFTWSVSDTKIATVDKTGIVTGKAPGIVTVRLTADNGVFGSVDVDVVVPGGNEDYGYEDLK